MALKLVSSAILRTTSCCSPGTTRSCLARKARIREISPCKLENIGLVSRFQLRPDVLPKRPPRLTIVVKPILKVCRKVGIALYKRQRINAVTIFWSVNDECKLYSESTTSHASRATYIWAVFSRTWGGRYSRARWCLTNLRCV